MRQTAGMTDPSAPPGSWFWTLADSELAHAALAADGGLTLVLAAAHLQHPGSGEAGHAPGLRLHLCDARCEGEPLPGRLREGRLSGLNGAGGWQPGCPVPGQWQAGSGPRLQLEWVGAWGDRVRVTASALTAQFDGGTVHWRAWLHC